MNYCQGGTVIYGGSGRHMDRACVAGQILHYCAFNPRRFPKLNFDGPSSVVHTMVSYECLRNFENLENFEEIGVLGGLLSLPKYYIRDFTTLLGRLFSISVIGAPSRSHRLVPGFPRSREARPLSIEAYLWYCGHSTTQIRRRLRQESLLRNRAY